ncbi:serine/threonine-protein kinase [Streptomyces griseus]|uniref:serine/threonine-protein kinase n=1 Tax=Streptomyces griseus TaxID=1911 RepID=UPI00055BEEAA|nr:serine/threonine-protein kinase [Streptomyces griseus]
MQPLGADEPTAMGPYRLLGRIGSGGMGRVYLGRSAGGRTVAVKIVHPHFALDEEFRARFRREVEAARRVGGAWTAPVLDADPDASVPWVATAYAAGPSLAGAVADGGALPEHTVRVLGAGLAEALTAVHDLGLVHRDVKPSNVLLTVDGPLLIDFGIARATDGTASLTSTGVSIGSPGYMSPEQILGKGATGAADVFSLGAVLAYAAAGESPFPGDSSAALLYKVVHEEARLGQLGGELREVVEACLAKDPAVRPTPRDVALRLAPEGTARLVAAGWLPGALVERVGRSAVQLLNLEAAGTAGAAPSGPVEFSSPSVGGASGVGEFGPPPVMPLPVMPPAVIPAPVIPPPATPLPVDALPYVPEPRDAPPQDGGVASGVSGTGPGRLSVSVAATSTPGDEGRGRRLSCTVALAVAGALAAVTVGSVFVFDLLPGGDRDSDSDTSAGGEYSAAPTSAPGSTPTRSPTSSPSSSATSSPTGSDLPSDAASQVVGVPARYLGTWQGQGTGLDGSVPMGTFRVTVKQVAVGEELGSVRNTDPFGTMVCVDVLTLKEVTDKQIVATSVGADSNPATCVKSAATVTLTPAGDGLTYASDSDGSGRPVARLAKVK